MQGGWKRAGLAVVAVFLIFLVLYIVGVIPQSGAWAALWMPFAALAGGWEYSRDDLTARTDRKVTPRSTPPVALSRR